MKTKTVCLELPETMANELRTFIKISGLSDGDAMRCLLPDLGPILGDPAEFEATIQGEYSLTIQETMTLDANLTQHFCAD